MVSLVFWARSLVDGTIYVLRRLPTVYKYAVAGGISVTVYLSLRE